MRSSPSQQSPQPRRELGKRERLGHIVVCTGIETGDTVFERISGTEDDDRQFALLRANVAQHLQTRRCRRHQVEHGRVIVDALRLHASLQTVVQDIDSVSLFLETTLDEGGNFVIVFEHQNAHRCSELSLPLAKIHVRIRSALL